ncbi:calcium uniporter protein mitochondrial, partial [Trifolium medium]|nr:calcium uniporter protein mitochondrial [Trifolium medium]
MDIGRSRISLEGLKPPATERTAEDGVSVGDVKKLLKVAQLELVKSKLRDTGKSCVTVSEFIRICSEYCS